MRLYIFRSVCEELKDRDYCEFTDWLNTANDDLCTHCVGILSTQLCLEDYIDVN